MEIKFSKNKLSFKIINDKINGIYTDNKEEVLNILSLKDKTKISIDNKKLTKEELSLYRHIISIIEEDFNYTFYNNTVYDYMINEIKTRNLILKDYDKKIKDSLIIVGLNKLILYRNITTLSESEKKLLQVAIGLLSNPEILVFVEPFKKLDFKNQKQLMMFLQKIKEKYNKKIVIITNDTNMIYKYCDYLIVFKDNIIKEELTRNILEDIDYLTNNKILLPEIVEFTYLAKKKYKVKIDYHNDIRDLIKDIYKHV